MGRKRSSRGGRHGKKGGKWKPLCAATASADWGEGYYQPSPQSGHWWWSEEWHPEAPSETSTVNALLKMAQEVQELAKTPWTREQWIDQVRCVQDGCDDTPNEEEEEHGTSLHSIMRKQPW